MRLPGPMLAKSGPLPDGPDWRFELKLDGFRAIVSTTGGLSVAAMATRYLVMRTSM